MEELLILALHVEGVEPISLQACPLIDDDLAPVSVEDSPFAISQPEPRVEPLPQSIGVLCVQLGRDFQVVVTIDQLSLVA